MAKDIFRELFGDFEDKRPNKFTIYLGDQIKKARMEKGISQEDLAQQIHKRRATLSDIENGKTEPDSSTLIFIAHTLDKHLGYFYPWYFYKEIKQEDLTPLENELLLHFRQIWDENLQKVAINQVQAISDFDPTETLWDAVDLTIAEKERIAEVEKFIEQKRKRKKL